jgi:hypothetical protein
LCSSLPYKDMLSSKSWHRMKWTNCHTIILIPDRYSLEAEEENLQLDIYPEFIDCHKQSSILPKGRSSGTSSQRLSPFPLLEICVTWQSNLRSRIRTCEAESHSTRSINWLCFMEHEGLLHHLQQPALKSILSQPILSYSDVWRIILILPSIYIFVFQMYLFLHLFRLRYKVLTPTHITCHMSLPPHPA